MNANLTLRTVAIATALLIAAAGCGSGAAPDTGPSGGALTPVTAVTALRIQGQDAPWLLGIEKGFFREAGIDLTVQPGSGTSGNLGLLDAGQAQFVVADLNGLALAYDEQLTAAPQTSAGAGAPWVGIAAIYQRTISAIAAHPDSGITSFADLEGKKVGYTEGGINKTIFPALAGIANVDDRAITWIPLDGPGLRPALASRRVDAVTDNVTGIPVLRKALGGKEPTILAYSEWLTDGYSNTWTTSRTLAEADPDLVRRFQAAAMKSLAYAVDHPQEATAAHVRANPEQDAASVLAEVESLRPYVYGTDGIGAITDTRMAQSIALLAGIGELTHQQQITPTTLVDFTLARPYTP